MYPEDCVQSIIAPTDWWVKNDKKVLCRGALVFAFIPHVDQVPYTLDLLGRKEADRHDSAIAKITPLRIKQPRGKTDLPVAAMPLYAGEVWAAYRAKKRPCLIIGSKNPSVNPELTRGMPKRSTAPTVLAMPYYGATKDGKRSGYNPEFVEQIRHCEYPQFLWDRLPIPGGPDESILRLDHLQPIGTHYNSYELSEHRLSKDAMVVFDELLQRLIWGKFPKDSWIAAYRENIESTFNT